MLKSYKLFKHKSLLTGSTHTLDNKQMISLMLVLRTNGLFLIFYKFSVSRCKTLLYILNEYTPSSNIYQWQQHLQNNFKLLNSTDLQSHHQLIQDSPTPLLPHHPHPPPANPPTSASYLLIPDGQTLIAIQYPLREILYLSATLVPTSLAQLIQLPPPCFQDLHQLNIHLKHSNHQHQRLPAKWTVRLIGTIKTASKTSYLLLYTTPSIVFPQMFQWQQHIESCHQHNTLSSIFLPSPLVSHGKQETYEYPSYILSLPPGSTYTTHHTKECLSPHVDSPHAYGTQVSITYVRTTSTLLTLDTTSLTNFIIDLNSQGHSNVECLHPTHHLLPHFAPHQKWTPHLPIPTHQWNWNTHIGHHKCNKKLESSISPKSNSNHKSITKHTSPPPLLLPPHSNRGNSILSLTARMQLQIMRSQPKLQEGGGSSNTSNHTNATNLLPTPIYPEVVVQKGPLQLAQFSNLPESQQLWQPEHYLPLTTDTSHPLIETVSSQLIDDIKKYCQQSPQFIIAFSNYRPTMAVQTSAFRNLISHRKLINDEVMNHFLECFCTQHNLAFLSPTFFNILHRDRGQRSLRHFASPSRHRHRTIYRPALQGERAIAIPCFIDDCHWVAVARVEMNGQVYFLYSDDLHNPSTEADVKTTLLSLGIEFYPDSAIWIKCSSYTYLPHSNECGARTLLALAVMMLHPTPSFYPICMKI
jgi:hypothetical protein